MFLGWESVAVFFLGGGLLCMGTLTWAGLFGGSFTLGCFWYLLFYFFFLTTHDITAAAFLSFRISGSLTTLFFCLGWVDDLRRHYDFAFFVLIQMFTYCYCDDTN